MDFYCFLRQDGTTAVKKIRNMNPQPISFIPADQKPDGIKQVQLFLSAKPFLTSFLLALLMVLPILAIFKIYFQFPDDNLIQLLFNGIGFNSAPSELNLQEGAFFSMVIKYLYLHWPGIQW